MFLRLITNLSASIPFHFSQRNINKSPLVESHIAGSENDPKKELTWTLLNILGRA